LTLLLKTSRKLEKRFSLRGLTEKKFKKMHCQNRSNAKKAIPQFYKACQFFASRMGKKFIIIILP
tara:strand:- start:2731 stop:2925 length:195 start_codon:yes stop_codon:yes gene_type:complete